MRFERNDELFEIDYSWLQEINFDIDLLEDNDRYRGREVPNWELIAKLLPDFFRGKLDTNQYNGKTKEVLESFISDTPKLDILEANSRKYPKWSIRDGRHRLYAIWHICPEILIPVESPLGGFNREDLKGKKLIATFAKEMLQSNALKKLPPTKHNRRFLKRCKKITKWENNTLIQCFDLFKDRHN